jgi:hypothetical protein
MGPNAVPEHRIMAHYDLAQFCSSCGDRAATFAHWQAGHALLRLSQPFSREAFSRFLDANMAAFDAATHWRQARAASSTRCPATSCISASSG